MRRSSSRLFRARLALELLEDRLAPAVFTVNTVADNTLVDGFTTLREAILAANAAPGADTINFNIPGVPTAVQTINPTSSLPFISGPVTIDGYTQGDAHPNTLAVGNDAMLLIEVNGAGLPANGGLRFGGGNNTVRGLVVNRFAGNGLSFFTSGGNRVEGNFIGTDTTGSIDLGNGNDGVQFVNLGNNVLGGSAPAARNVIAGNAANGVAIYGTSANGNIIEGNYIGTNAAGSAAMPNGTTAGGQGVLIVDSQFNRIGGAATGAGNLISGNGQNGVAIFQPTATGNVVEGNFIGTNATGTAAIPNGHAGVILVNGAFENVVGGNVVSGNGANGIQLAGGSHNNLVQGNYVGTNADGTTAIGNAATGIGVVDSANNQVSGNLVSGNVHRGIGVTSNSAATSGTTTGNVIRGNFIGTNAAGTGAIPNLGDGVTIGSSGFPGLDNTIGGPTAADRNIIAGNLGSGVSIINQSSGNLVQGNYIGADVNGDPLGNANWGVGIFNNADNNSILDNLILANSLSGISVAPAYSTGNMFAGNRIFGNGWVPIDLTVISDANQVTLNDLGDGDAGANNYQNFPFIAGVNTLGPDTFISGSLYSTPSTNFRLEFFAADTLSPSGHRQAQYVLGTLDVTTDATGLATFVFEYAGSLPGPIVTATATNLATGDTSEFFNPSRPTDITLSNATIQENAGANALVGTLTTTDPDLGDSHYYTLVSGTGDTDNSSFTIVGNQLCAVDSLNYEDGATRSVRVRTTDLHGLTFEKTFTITILDENETPTFTNVPANLVTNEDESVGFTATAVDPDGGELTFAIASGPAHGTLSDFDPTTGYVKYTPEENYFGLDSFSMTVTDGTNTSNPGTISINVQAINDAPGAGDDSFSIDEDGSLIGTVMTNDEDVDSTTLTAALVANVAHGSLEFAADGTFVYTPNANFNGLDSFTYRLNDGEDDSNTATVTFHVTAVNDAPVISSLTNSAQRRGRKGENDTVNLELAFIDPDVPDSHSAFINWGDGTSSLASMTAAGGLATGSHQYAAGGVYTITVTLSDAADATAVATSTAYITGAGIHNGVLQIVGTHCDDHVSINEYCGDWLKVHADFFGCENFRTYSLAAVQRIEVYLFGGDDHATISDHVNLNATLHGGKGDDHLIGGGGNDILIGGKGNDTLAGGKGRDILIGGLGGDRLVGNAADDILIAGTTDYDSDRIALFAILDEWTRTDRTYSQRVHNLRHGGGWNGSVILNDETVHDDGAVDRLTGAAGIDWFFANLGGGILDIITDDQDNEDSDDID